VQDILPRNITQTGHATPAEVVHRLVAEELLHVTIAQPDSMELMVTRALTVMEDLYGDAEGKKPKNVLLANTLLTAAKKNAVTVKPARVHDDGVQQPAQTALLANISAQSPMRFALFAVVPAGADGHQVATLVRQTIKALWVAMIVSALRLPPVRPHRCTRL
jgi:hypothetical protein